MQRVGGVPMSELRTLANAVWFLFGGLVAGLLWSVAGVVCYAMVVTIPFGVACFRIARFVFFPFGKELVDARLLGERPWPGSTIANLLWFALCGWWLAISEILIALGLLLSCVSIFPIFLGAPVWAWTHLRLAGVVLWPLGKRIVTVEEAKVLRDLAARRRFAHLAK